MLESHPRRLRTRTTRGEDTQYTWHNSKQNPYLAAITPAIFTTPVVSTGTALVQQERHFAGFITERPYDGSIVTCTNQYTDHGCSMIDSIALFVDHALILTQHQAGSLASASHARHARHAQPLKLGLVNTLLAGHGIQALTNAPIILQQKVA